MLYVPANCTDLLQPLNLSIKNQRKTQFLKWYSKKVANELESGKCVGEVKVGLQMNVVKPSGVSRGGARVLEHPPQPSYTSTKMS